MHLAHCCPGFDMAAKERFSLLSAAREFGFDLPMIAFMRQSYRLLAGPVLRSGKTDMGA